MQGREDLENRAIEAARGYCAARGWSVTQIRVTATVTSPQSQVLWVRVRPANNGEDGREFRYVVDMHGVGTLAPVD